MEGVKDVVVEKYGGSALKEPLDFLKVAERGIHIEESGSVYAPVCSAGYQWTNRLQEVASRQASFDEYAGTHEAFFEKVFEGKPELKDRFMGKLRARYATTRGLLGAAAGEYDPDHVTSCVESLGEVEAGLALAHLLEDTIPGIECWDGYKAGIVRAGMRGPIDVDRSVENIRRNLGESHRRIVLAPFSGINRGKPDCYAVGERNVNDVDASVYGVAQYAVRVVNVKDKPVYVCAPKYLAPGKQSKLIRSMSYKEAMKQEEILHKSAIIVCQSEGIQIDVTTAGAGDGITTITGYGSLTTPERPFAGMVVYDDVASVSVFDPDMTKVGAGRGYLRDFTSAIARSHDVLDITAPSDAITTVVAGDTTVSKDRRVGIVDIWASLTRALRRSGRRGTVVGGDIALITLFGDSIELNPIGAMQSVFGALAEGNIPPRIFSYGGDAKYVESPAISVGVDKNLCARTVDIFDDKLF